MLGWWISIYRTEELSLPEKHVERETFDKEHYLSSWKSGLGGIDWLFSLVEEGKAEDLGGNGYPNSFRARAKNVFPIIAKGIPSGHNPPVIGEDYFMPESWSGDIRKDVENIKKCDQDDWLLIEAWDLS